MRDAPGTRRVRKARAAKAYGCALVAALLVAACGLKGPLTLPEKSKNVVVRPGPGGAAVPATPPEPVSEPLPPPELPPDTRGNTRG